MMVAAAGIDLGGSKIEAQLFDAGWNRVDRRRVATPEDYEGIVAAAADQVRWALSEAGGPVPVGIGAAGLVDRAGYALTANLPANGRPLPGDIAGAAGHPVTHVNDCRALALSEAHFGAGRGHGTVMSLIIGTGVGGGVAFDGKLRGGPSGTGGEYGHMPAPAPVVAAHGLPIHKCGCGRTGCIETYVAGPGLARMARDLTGREIDPERIGLEKDGPGDAGRVWSVWVELASELVLSLVQTVDPDIIVLGGGLSRVPGVLGDLEQGLAAAQLAGFAVPKLALAEGGDASGARGAALAAVQESAGG